MNMINPFTKPITSIDNLDLSAIDFEVERQPIYGERTHENSEGRSFSHFSKIDGKYEYFRKDTGATLGVHTASYNHDGYKKHVSHVIEAVKEMGTLDQLDTSNAETKFSVYEDGRKLKLELLFPNNIIEPQIGDITKLRLRDWDSYDGSWGRRLWIDGMRLWCLNGCTSPAFKLGFYAKHTKSISGDESIHRMLTSMKSMVSNFYEDEAKFKRWISTNVTQEEAQELFSKTLAFAPKAVEEDGKWKHHSPNVMDDLRANIDSNFSQVGRNLYGVYNAATEWATHVQTKRGQIHNIERTRESKVASMLNSPDWNRLERFAA